MRGRERCDEILRLIDETLDELGLVLESRSEGPASAADRRARRGSGSGAGGRG